VSSVCAVYFVLLSILYVICGLIIAFTSFSVQKNKRKNLKNIEFYIL
jgi:hypothetical protein